MTTRKIKSIFKSRPTIEGAGVHLKRAFGYSQVPAVRSFFDAGRLPHPNPAEYLAGFPWHPHRGIETITYVLEGLVEHGDSMGNKGVIAAGDVQWMTAGSGIIHQEMPQESPTGTMWGFQFWANLPANENDCATLSGGKGRRHSGSYPGSGVKIKIVSGRWQESRDRCVTSSSSRRCSMSVCRRAQAPSPGTRGHTAVAYVLDGDGYFDERRDAFAYEMGVGLDGFQGMHLRPGNGGALRTFWRRNMCNLRRKGVRFLFISGKPLNEPVAWYGPIVMNTQEELRIAFEEYEKGTFIKGK